MYTDVYKALSDESRLRILNLLMQNELCVCELEMILDISQTNVSRHLNKLKNADIISCEKKSQWVYYSMNASFVNKHRALYEHLKTTFDKDNISIDDTSRLLSLKQQQIVCCGESKKTES